MVPLLGRVHRVVTANSPPERDGLRRRPRCLSSRLKNTLLNSSRLFVIKKFLKSFHIERVAPFKNAANTVADLREGHKCRFFFVHPIFVNTYLSTDETDVDILIRRLSRLPLMIQSRNHI